MKWILCLLAFTPVLCFCDIINVNEHKIHVATFNYHDHEWVYFASIWTSGMVIKHSPNCKCKNQIKESFK